MDDRDLVNEHFEASRARLRAVAYRMLGSPGDADDAVQETWLRLQRSDADGVENLGGWLTTVVARVSLNMLRSRAARREQTPDTRLPDPVVSRADRGDPEHQAVLADSVGLALLVVLDTLTPAERLAFVLHDLFDVPFDEIAAIVGRSPAAARQLASRARRRVHGTTPAAEPDRARQRAVVEAFLAASRGGDLAALGVVLHPEVVLRADTGVGLRTVRGAQAVAEQASSFRHPGRSSRRVLVDGVPGAVTVEAGRPVAVLGFVVWHDLIVGIDILADPERLGRLDLDPSGPDPPIRTSAAEPPP